MTTATAIITATAAYDTITAFLLAHGFSADACNDFSDAGHRWKSFRDARDDNSPSFLVAKSVDATALVGDYAHDWRITPFVALPAFEAHFAETMHMYASSC